MSEDRQGRIRRPVPPPREAAERVTPVEAGAEQVAEAAARAPESAAEVVAALPEPEQAAALPAPPPEVKRDADRYVAAYRATLTSIGESQAAIASDVAAMAIEMSGLARANLTAAGDSVTAMLTARSLVDAVEAQLGFARRSLDMFAGGSTRLGEIGLRLANDATKPVMRALATA